jgi:hypothetical protein
MSLYFVTKTKATRRAGDSVCSYNVVVMRQIS